MAKVDIIDIKTELVVFLRNQDVIPIATRGVTTITEEFNGDNSETDFVLSNTNVKNVRSVSVDASSKTFGIDYTVNYNNATVTFTSAPATGTNNVDITYDYGSTDRIFPDFPQSHLKLSAFPRIAIDIISGTTTEFELGAGTNRSEYLVSVVCYDKDITDVENLVSGVREKIMDNKKNFFNFPFVTLTSTGLLSIIPWGNQKLFQRSQDMRVMFVYEN